MHKLCQEETKKNTSRNFLAFFHHNSLFLILLKILRILFKENARIRLKFKKRKENYLALTLVYLIGSEKGKIKAFNFFFLNQLPFFFLLLQSEITRQ